MSISIRSLSYKSKLIETVRQKPELWRVSRKAPGLKQKLWHAVGKELGTSGFDARRQWEILRDQFRREFKRSRSEAGYKSRWIYYNRMMFMRQALRPRDGHTDTDIDQKSPMDAAEQSLATQMEAGLPKIQVRQDLHNNEQTVFSNEATTSTGVSSSSGPRYEDTQQQHCRRRWRPESTEDEDYHFVMSILPSLRSIQQSRKLRVRSMIMDVIAGELELGCEVDASLEVSRSQIKFEPEESDADE